MLAHSPSLKSNSLGFEQRLLGQAPRRFDQRASAKKTHFTQKRAVDSWRPSGLIAVSGSSLAGSFLPPHGSATARRSPRSRNPRGTTRIPTESTSQRRAKTRNIPRIPHIPRHGTRATAKWGMWGKGGKISPVTRWPRPILRETRMAGAGGYERSPGSGRSPRFRYSN